MATSKGSALLLPPELHDHLERVAEQRGISLGELVRHACETQYGVVSEETRLAAVRELAALSLPVGDPDQMKRESVPGAEDLLP